MSQLPPADDNEGGVGGTSDAAAMRGPMTTIPFDQPVALTSSGAPLLNPRSCVTSRRRKVRCDKTKPCHNCRRAQISCIYPAPGRAPRRPRPRDPNAPPKGSSEREQVLLKRLHKLEGIVEELSGQVDGSSGGGGDTASSAPTAPTGGDTETFSSVREAVVTAHAHDGEEARRKNKEAAAAAAGASIDPQTGVSTLQKHLGRLVLHDKERAARYVSNAFWSELKDELDELRNDVHAFSEDTEDSGDDPTPDQSPSASGGDNGGGGPVHHAFLLGYSSADVDLSKLHPLPSQVPFLWQIYQENVDPLVKVLHKPSIEALMRELRRNPQSLKAADQALIFTIYYAAIASMEEDEVVTNFGAPQAHFLSQFRFALEQALAQANLLNTTDIAVVQSLAIFLMIARRHDDTKFCWTMTALVVRIAQALGLHRDGVQLGLPPFEVETRRRLWWAIMALDLRSAEELGSDLTVSDRSFDTQLPSNIDDVDMDENTAEMPGPREGRTDTAVSLVRYEICALARRLHTIMAEMGTVKNVKKDVSASLEERERMLIEVHDRVEQKFLRHVMTDNDPLFWVASMVARIIMSKIGLLIYQPVLFPGTGPELSRAIRARLFISTIEIVEYNHILNIDPRCKAWRWFFQTYRQWHAIAYMLLDVSRRPWSVTSERAWEAAQILGYDGHSLEQAKQTNHTAVWMPMKKLYLRAKRHREAEIARLRADPAAAEQLDVEERMNPFPERLDPVAGMEARTSQLRARWRRLVRADVPEDRPPFPINNHITPPMQANQQQANQQQQQQQKQQQQVPGPADMADFTSQDVWHYVYEGGGGTTAAGLQQPSGLYPPSVGASMSSSIKASPAVSGRLDPSAAEAALKNQAMAQMQQQQQQQQHQQDIMGDGSNPEAWMWTDPFLMGNMNAPVFEDMPQDDFDVNMDFGDDFDWNDFQRQLKGFR